MTKNKGNKSKLFHSLFAIDFKNYLLGENEVLDGLKANLN